MTSMILRNLAHQIFEKKNLPREMLGKGTIKSY